MSAPVQAHYGIYRTPLYDQDAGAEFIHAHAHSFHDRFFFFEFVELRGSECFGAANASVRMAAQAGTAVG